MAGEALLQSLSSAFQSKKYKAVQRCMASLKNYSSIPVHTCTINGLSLLQIAVEMYCTEAVRMLLEKGASANVNLGNEFLIHRAVSGGDINIVKQLIRYGAKVDSVDEDGQTPLFRAVSDNDVEMVKLLLKSGASLEIRSKNRETILEFAAMWDAKVQIFETLLNFGVDVNAPFSDNSTLLVTIVCFFLEDNVDEKRAEALLRLVLENGALIKESHSEECLHVAARYGLSTPMTILLEHGVNINVKSQFEKTPLGFALDEFYKITYLFLRRNEDEVLTLDNVEPFKDTAFMLIQEVVKLQEAKKDVMEENMKEARDERVEFFYEFCMKEIDEMRNEKIVTGVSYFDLLTAEEYKLASHIRNIQILKILRKGGYKKKFPLYADALEACIKMGKARNKLLSSSTELLKKILNFKLPDEIVHEIFCYFKSTDLVLLPKVMIRHRR